MVFSEVLFLLSLQIKEQKATVKVAFKEQKATVKVAFLM